MASSWAFVPMASTSLRIAIKQFDVPTNLSVIPSIIACTHQSCHRCECLLRVPKSAICNPSISLSRWIFSHSRVIARAYRTCNSKRPIDRRTARDRSSMTTASAGISQSMTSGQVPLKVNSNCPSRFSRTYGGNESSSSQVMNSGWNICRMP